MEIKDLFKKVQPRLASYVRSTGDYDLVAEFVSATPGTVMSWANGSQNTSGTRLIRLWYFLAAAGCESPELGNLPPLNQYLGELFAYQCISLDEAMQYANLKNEQSALLMLRGTPPMHPAMSAQDLEELYQEQLDKSKQVLQDKLQAVRGSSAPAQPAPTATTTAPAATSPSPPTLPVGTSADSKVYTLATLLSAAMPLARNLVSDRCKPADRALLRELMGEEGVFEMSNLLNALCGERARSSSTTTRK